MALLRIEGLPEGALKAAAEFHARHLPRIRGDLELINPPRDGEGNHPQDGGGASRSEVAPAGDSPPSAASRLPPPRPGEDLADHLTLVFAPADHTHRGWRLAAVQQLAREYAPARVNAVVGDDEAAIAAAESYLAQAKGVTGQLLALDTNGAGQVLYG